MEGVGATGLITAAARAFETDRADGLLSDPLARFLAGDEGFEMLAGGPVGVRASNGSSLYVVRHRFFDDVLIELLSTTDVRQVVLLAAGLDTRAFRLDWPQNTRVFELDQRPVFDRKQRVLDTHAAQPRCDRTVVIANLRHDWVSVLLSSGFDRHRPTAWIAEGLLFYLPEADVHQLLDDTFALSAPGSHLIADMMGATPGPPQQLRERFAELGAPFVFSTDDPAGLTRGHGWEATAIGWDEVGRRLSIELHAPGGRVVLAHR